MRKHILISLGLFAIVWAGAWAARSFGFYNSYWFTDVILHTIAGAGFGYLWLAVDRRKQVDWVLVLAAANFAVLGSVAWEIWEFAGWRITPSHMRFYIPELGDSLGDICAGFMGGAIAVLARGSAKASLYFERSKRS